MDMNYTKGAVSGNEGLALLKEVNRMNSDMAIIVMTAYSEVDLASRVNETWSKRFCTKTLDQRALFYDDQKCFKKVEVKNRRLRNIGQQPSFKRMSPLTRTWEWWGLRTP